MDYIIKDEINVLYEINKTFMYLANEEEEISKFNETLDGINIDNEKYKKNNLKSFYKYINKFKKLNKISMDKIKFYFSDISDEKVTNGKSIFEMIFINYSVEELIELKNKIIDSSEEEMRILALKQIIKFIMEGFNDKGISFSMSREEFIKYLIDSKEFSYAVKWRLIIFIEDSKNHILEFIDIFLETINIFKTIYVVFEKDKKIFVEYLKKSMENSDNYLTELSRINVKKLTPLIIYPSMVDFKSISLSVNDDEIINSKEKRICYFGYKFEELLKGTKNKDELLYDKLKCISDKSKYEILRMLKNEPMYGQQIAEKLNLTTATISYHMNSLAINKLILINKVDNKVYYSSNKDEIKKICGLISEQLL